MSVLYIRYPGIPTSDYPLLAPDGTAAAPSYSFANSASTGMYSPAANQLGLATNGSVALTLSSSQNAVFANKLSVGGSAVSANAMINVATSTLAGTTQQGILSALTGTSAATNGLIAFRATLTGANNTNIDHAEGIFIDTPTPGASSTITWANGIEIAAQNGSGITNSASISDNHSYSSNWFINSTNTNPSQFSGLVGVMQSVNNVTDALPTQAEMVSAFGAANQGTGLMGVIKDANADTNFFICISNGTSWYALKMTKGA